MRNIKNKQYYGLLSLFSLFLLLFTIIRTDHKNRRYLLPLFLAFTGLNYILEYYVLVISKAYRYFPKVFKNAYFDNIFGATVSQLLVVPTTGLLLSILNIKYRWSLLFTLIITSIEILFLKKKIFKNYWWKTYYTLIGLQLFYLLATFWRKQLIEKKNKHVKIMTVFLSIFVTHTTLMFYHVSFLRTFLFNVKWFKNPFRSHIAFATLYTWCSSIIICSCIYLKIHFINF